MSTHTEENLELTWDDVTGLLRINPLATEQLKNIALRRKMADLERQLAEPKEDAGQSLVGDLARGKA